MQHNAHVRLWRWFRFQQTGIMVSFCYVGEDGLPAVHYVDPSDIYLTVKRS